jgi:transposase
LRFESFLTTPSARGGRPPANHRRVVNGILWIRRTGAPRRDLSEEFCNWSSDWRQFRRWRESGVWDVLLQGLVDSGDALMEQRDSNPGAMVADRGYDSDAIRHDCAIVVRRPRLLTKSNRKAQHSVNEPLYALRSCIECFIGHLKEQRRIAPPAACPRAGKAVPVGQDRHQLLGFISLGCIRLWIRFVHTA